MTVFLHAGVHKTATTSLQALMRDNIRELRDQGIACMPKRLAPYGPGDYERLRQRVLSPLHRLTSSKRLNKGESRDLRRLIADTLRDEQGDLPHLLFSDEVILGGRPYPSRRLYPAAAKRLAVLVEALSPQPVKVILYLRDQPSYLESAYVQHIQMQKALSWPEYRERLELDRMHWSSVTDAIISVLGAKNLVVGHFDQMGAGFLECAANFFSLFCDPGRLQLRPVKANPTPSARGVALARLIGPRVPARAWPWCRKLLQRHFSTRTGQRARFFSEEERHELLALYAGDTQRVLDTYANNREARP